MEKKEEVRRRAMERKKCLENSPRISNGVERRR